MTKRFRLERVKYSDLNSRQKEVFNFQKVAGTLADYGFNCIKLADDWCGADFLAYHKDGESTLKIQLKSRLSIDKKYEGRGLFLTFPVGKYWYLVEHDKLVKHLQGATSFLVSRSWTAQGEYNTKRPSRELMDWLKPFQL